MTAKSTPAGGTAVVRAFFWLPRSARAGALILVVLVIVTLLAPLIAPHDPNAIDPTHVLAAPDLGHPFGADALGRDVFSRTVYALRTSLAIVFASVAVASLAALPLGTAAGYFGGWVDQVISRPLDMLLVLPALLLAITLIAIVGPGSIVAALAIALIYLPILARVQRAASLVVAHAGFVEGGRARGWSSLAVLRRHVVPNALGPLLVQAAILAGFAVQIEASLSFLGLGTQPPTPSLGLMLSEGRDVLTQAPWVEIFPGLAIAVIVLAFNLLGDGLRHRLDPQGMAS
ncbi:ABC transporter permease [Microbispora hainanensis]|uniref:ABC transporter permease n=1 Tax=Microbispora hainanensis TaxID=568844 RepID=A0A544YPC4_9ACTN|nr:ABC transporter permease [Microbispora hainanensis]TQS18576.1 ABC transporter permease [Microbispora hainanensis]